MNRVWFARHLKFVAKDNFFMCINFHIFVFSLDAIYFIGFDDNDFPIIFDKVLVLLLTGKNNRKLFLKFADNY